MMNSNSIVWLCYNITTKDNNNHDFKRFILCTQVARTMKLFTTKVDKVFENKNVQNS